MAMAKKTSRKKPALVVRDIAATKDYPALLAEVGNPPTKASHSEVEFSHGEVL